MSTFEHKILIANTAEETRQIGLSLAKSLYSTPLNLLLHGDLGAGKTTFAQGFAAGLGIEDRVVSPSFALEQHYAGATIVHIDLYRLSPGDASAFLRSSEEFAYVRIIEWPMADWTHSGPFVRVDIDDAKPGSRTLHIVLHDMPLPDAAEIDQWYDDVALPTHIIKHNRTVAAVTRTLADHLLERATFVRKDALKAAALTHDLLRFVDFASLEGDAQFSPTTAQSALWKTLKKRYGAPHERAAAMFFREKGYEGLARIVESHGPPREDMPAPQTTEQKLLCYADKRVKFDTLVTLDQRFDDFIARYGKGKELAYAKAWRVTMKELEKQLFPEGPPL